MRLFAPVQACAEVLYRLRQKRKFLPIAYNVLKTYSAAVFRWPFWLFASLGSERKKHRPPSLRLALIRQDKPMRQLVSLVGRVLSPFAEVHPLWPFLLWKALRIDDGLNELQFR